MTHRRADLVSIIVVALVLSFASVVKAQIEIGNFIISGGSEVGALPQSFSGSRNKYEEYRDLSETVIVPEMEFKIEPKMNDYYLEYDSSKLGLDDQNYTLRFGKYGLWNMEFEWDQIPHLFNDETAGTPYGSKGGTFRLSSKPTMLGTLDCVTVGTVCQWVNSSSSKITLKLHQGFSRFKARYTPMPGWTFNAGYQYQNTSGDRAISTVTNGFSWIVELPEPIDYQTQTVELGGEYAASWWTLGFKYNGSFFRNKSSNMTWDIPFNISGVGAACVDAVGDPCLGRMDMYPDNQAHTWSLTGTAALPLKTHFMGSVSYGMRLQDDSFLPFTINTAIAQPALLRDSLDGNVRPTTVNMTLVNRFFDDLDLKGYYRFYDLDNKSEKLFLPGGYIRTDTGAPTAVAEGLRSFPYAYSKNSLGIDASYKVTQSLRAKFGYGWERMHRERREVLNANEHNFGPTFDIQPYPWLLVRASYRRYLRDAHDYDAGRAVVYETGLTPQEIRDERLEALRKVDEAARDRDKVSIFTQVSPLDNLTFHGGFEFTNDRFDRTEIGLQKDINYSPSVGFMYSPAEWVRVFGDYNWDRFDWKLKAMERSAQFVAGCPARDLQTPENCPTSVWTSRGDERVHTVSLGTDADLIKDLLKFRLQYGFSYGRSVVKASGNTTPGNVPATDYPTIKNRWYELLARFEYALHKNVSLNFGYYFNRYDTQDLGVDIMKLWMGDVDAGADDSIWLGDRLKGDYKAHVGFLSVSFKF